MNQIPGPGEFAVKTGHVACLPLDDRGAQLLFQVCSKRYEKSSTIVTTNTEPKKWGAIFNGNAMTASAILDRLLHHSTEVVIDGESYRARERAR
jgi:DNA replication protein DnaC